MNPALPVRVDFRTDAPATPVVTTIATVTTRSAFLLPGFAVVLILQTIACQQEAAVPGQLRSRITPVAEDFCEKIVPCVRNDMEERLHAEPQRRFYLQGRMTQATCVDNQVRSLAGRPDDLVILEQCNRTLAANSSCSDRLGLLKTSPCSTALGLK